MGASTGRTYAWTPFGFVVLILVFQRAYSFYSPLSMDYQVLLGLASVATWAIVFFVTAAQKDSSKLFFVVSLALLGAAFFVQEAFLVLAAQGVHDRGILSASCVLFASGYALYCRLWMRAYEKKTLVKTLICISATSGISTIIACLPPLVVGFDLFGNVCAFIVRMIVLEVKGSR